MRRSLFSQSVLSTAGVLSQGLARFGYSILIARFVGASELAVVNTLISLSIILSLLWPTAAGNAAGAFLARARARDASTAPVLRALWRSFAVSAVILVVLGVPIALIATGADGGRLAAFAALTVAWSAYIMTRGIRMGLGQVAETAVWDTISAVISLALLAAVIAAGADPLLLWPLAIGYLVFVVAALPGMRSSTRTSDPTAPPAASRIAAAPEGLWRFIATNSVALLATNGLLQFAMVFAYANADPVQAGMFAAAMALATPASMLAQAVSQVLIPRFAFWLHEDPAAARRRYGLVLLVLVGVLVVAFGLVAVLAGWLVPFVYGGGYEGSVQVLRILLVGAFLFSVGIIASSFLITSWRTGLATASAVVGTAIGVVLMYALLPALTASDAAAWGVVAGTAVTAVSSVALSLRRSPAESGSWTGSASGAGSSPGESGTRTPR